MATAVSAPGRGLPVAAGKAAIHTAHHINVGSLRDTGHSTELTPLAAAAEELTFVQPSWVSALGRFESLITAGSDPKRPFAPYVGATTKTILESRSLLKSTPSQGVPCYSLQSSQYFRTAAM